uniref:PNPLA domain-containing protein n=1 Tax=Plectus sambesii TaxID=2011161 RepID=A0A914WPJ9_9BILA
MKESASSPTISTATRSESPSSAKRVDKSRSSAQRCGHQRPQHKRKLRFEQLLTFLATATDDQKTTKLIEYWQEPNSTITELRLLLTLGACPEQLYENEFGQMALRGRIEQGLCHKCIVDHENFLDRAMDVWNAQFRDKPIVSKVADAKRKSGLVALALDGGGIRGLVSITMLMFISRRLFGNERIVDHSDWLAGTSTGSMLALAITKGMSLTTCFHQYIKGEIFVESSSVARLFGSVVKKQTENLDAILAKTFDDAVDTFTNMTDKRLSVPALDISTTPARLEVFRNYSVHLTDPDLQPSNVTFRDAAKASSAAPTFFYPHLLNGRRYVDGSMAANCPLGVLLQEYDLSQKFGGISSLGCVISLGTGDVSATDRQYTYGGTLRKKTTNLLHLTQLLLEQVSGYEQSTLQCARNRCAAYDIPFFRFSPPAIDVVLNETDPAKLMTMVWKTFVYMTDNAQEVDRLGQMINSLYSTNNNFDESKKRSNTIL